MLSIFSCLLAIGMSSLEKCLFRPFFPLFDWVVFLFCFFFLAFTCMSGLYILEISPCQLFALLLFSPILRVVFLPCL